MGAVEFQRGGGHGKGRYVLPKARVVAATELSTARNELGAKSGGTGMYWLGLFLLICGTLSLLFNEFTMRARRAWPWRRNDEDAEADARLNEYYRFSVFLGSVVSIELGRHFAALELGHWALRVLIYAAFGTWLFWRRPALRSRQFWKQLLESR